VLSALGENLIAEIDIPEITADEAASLRATIASPAAFKAAGLDYNSSLTGAQISLQGRANGSVYLRLSSDRAINEPFIDLIVEANWASGRIVRDYTMLFDPASMRQAAAPTLTAPAKITSPAVTPTPATPVGSVAPAAPATASTPAAVSTPPAQPSARPEPVAKATPAAPKDGVTVKPGDTAGSLASRYKPEGVSLDQMLVAMLSASPDAFTNNNVNRLKSGAVIDMQAATAAAPNETTAQAKQTIATQAKDFNEFRRRLAQSAPNTDTETPSRADSGQVQAKVSEPKTQSTAADKLTLSKANAAAKAQEEKIAKEKQAKANETRAAELSKNIQDLNKLNTTTVAKPVPATPATPAGSFASACCSCTCAISNCTRGNQDDCKPSSANPSTCYRASYANPRQQQQYQRRTHLHGSCNGHFHQHGRPNLRACTAPCSRSCA
jgi:pilus assembly protein FimV